MGIGAIGGPLAESLARNNVDVTAVTKHAELAETIREKGLEIHWEEEIQRTPMKAVPSVTDLEGKYGIIFLAMKATEVVEAATQVISVLKEDGVVITLQNGVVEDEVRKIVGKNRVIGAAVARASTVIQPGVIKRNFDLGYYIGLLDVSGNQKRLEETAKLLEYDLPVIVCDNIFGALYTKLGINAALNGLGAISGLSIEKWLRDPQVRLLCMGIITEMIAVVDKLNISLIKIGNILTREIVLNKTDTPEIRTEKHKILIEALEPLKNLKSSTQRSLERGQKSEIDYLNGYIAKKGVELGIHTPINSKITQIVKEIETGLREMSPDNLSELPVPQ